MRTLATIIVLLFSISAFGQETISLKKEIDLEVRRIENEAASKPVRFSIQAMKKVLHYISYSYVEKENDYFKISRQFSEKMTQQYRHFI